VALHPAVLVAFGVVVGFLGTLVGVGGGFFMVPYLHIAGGLGTVAAAGSSAAAIVLNVGSGSVRWALQRRLDWRLGILLGLASLPGTWLGHLAAVRISTGGFQLAFGVMMGAMAVAMMRSRPVASEAGWTGWFRRGVRRRFTDAFGQEHEYGVNVWAGAGVSVAAGFAAGLFGIGGGFLQVPFLIVACGVPVHVAVATSSLALLITSSAVAGQYAATAGGVDWAAALWTGAGCAVGAQAAATVAPRIPGARLKLVLAGLLVLVAAAMCMRGLGFRIS